MKKTIVQSALMLGLVVFTTIALSPNIASGNNPKSSITLKVNNFIQVERILTEVKIVPGDSMSNQRAREVLVAQNREVVARERSTTPAINTSLSFDELRSIYRQAADKFGIDPRLIEAVHQVETGKSTTCVANHSGSGATGPMQFLPSTFRHYSSGNICNVNDAVFAAADLLASSGASSGDIDSALFSYNHSQSYVNLVKSVMNSI